MLTGTIVENSLADKNALSGLDVIKSWADGSWTLHQVSLTRTQAIELSNKLAGGPWYMHFWEPGSDDVLVIFKEHTFDIKHSDRSTWDAALQFGKSIGIPEEQLDFPIS